MVDTLSILQAVNRLAAGRIPELTAIYLDLVPQGFLRPSLLIQSVDSVCEDASAELVRVVETLLLRVFVPVDDHANSDTASLLELRQKVLNLFRRGALPVGDRWLHVSAATGERDWDSAEITLRLEFHDVRDEDEDLTERMLSIHTNVNNQKG